MENIYKAFIKFQTEFQGMKPDATNPFFKSSYITLDGILETVRPLLAKQGLAVIQEVRGSEGAINVKSKLIHESGEMLETEPLEMRPVKNNDPQAMGSCITYAKRYQLAALLGICESVDDDGNQATYGTNTKSNKKEDKKENKSGILNDAQIKRLYAITHSKNISPETVKAQVLKKFNKKVDELTKDEYDIVCKGYEGMNSK